MARKTREVATLLAAVAALIAAIAGAAVSFSTKQAVYQVELSINGRMDEFLKSARENAYAAGIIEGRDDVEDQENGRADIPTP